jgi:hypothetical protein
MNGLLQAPLKLIGSETKMRLRQRLVVDIVLKF